MAHETESGYPPERRARQRHGVRGGEVTRFRRACALGRLRPAPSHRTRSGCRCCGRAGAAEHRTVRLDLRADRRFGPHRRCRGAEGSRPRPDGSRHPGHLRPGAEHDPPRPGPGLRRDHRRVRHFHRGERTRLLRLSRLPARVPRSLRDARQSGDEGRRRGRGPFPHPFAAAQADQGRDHPRRGETWRRLSLDPELLRPGCRRPRLRPLRLVPAAPARLRRGRPDPTRYQESSTKSDTLPPIRSCGA